MNKSLLCDNLFYFKRIWINKYDFSSGYGQNTNWEYCNIPSLSPPQFYLTEISNQCTKKKKKFLEATCAITM